MKTTRVLRWVVVASLGTIAACGGVSDIGKGDQDPNGMGKGANGTGANGNGVGGAKATGGGDPGVGAKPGMYPAGGAMAVGGGSPAGSCVPEECSADDGPCQMCEDGTFSCPKAYCAGDKCVQTGGVCATACENDMDCPVIDIACTECGNGERSCPATQCVMGQCQTSFPGCGNIDPCAGQACGSECKPCGPEGMCAPDHAAYCSAEGKCQPGLPQCGMDPGGTTCESAMDCPSAPPNCIDCGNETCAGFECIANKCVFACPANPNPQCMTTNDCPAMDAVCKMCPGGSCAETACLSGSCELVCRL